MGSPAGSNVKFIHSGTHRACVNCAAAKARCVPRGPAGSARCERCNRLNTVCGVPMRQERKRSRRRGQATLAQKVDEIVTLLASKPAGVGGYSEGVTPASGPVPETPVTLQTLVIDDAEAEALLCSFRQNQASFAPFVEIAEGATASSLRSEKPLFFLSVMVAACHRDSARQENFSRASMALIADQVLVRGQKNLALLQGMLVLLNWYQTQVLINPQITNLLHLCIALATDLGLNQSPMTAETHTLTHGAIKAIHGPAVYPESRTLEEQRAYAGCFYLSSVIATSSSISTELPWSAQLEESCHVLGRSERDGDVRLATHLRLQRIISQIAQVQKEITANGGLAASLTVYTTPFEERLTQLWNDCPETIRQDVHIRLNHHIALMHLYKISLVDTRPTTAAALDPTAAVALQHARHRCLREAHASLEVYLTVPLRRFYHQPLAPFTQVSHAMTMLARLCRPDFGLESRPPVFLPALLERVAEHIDRVADAVGDEGTDSRRRERLAYWAAWLRRCICRLDAMEGSGEFAGVGVSSGAAGAGSAGAGVAGAGSAGAGVTGDDVTNVTAGGGPSCPAISPGEGCLGGVGAPGAWDGDFSGMDWAALVDDISGFGLFGFADDDGGIFSGGPDVGNGL